MQMTWFEKLILRIFLPTFSESDIIGLLYPILIAIVLNGSLLLNFILEGLIPREISFDEIVEIVRFLIVLVVVAIFVYTTIHLTIKHAFSDEQVKYREKSFLIFVYYLCVFSLTLLSFMYYVPVARLDPYLNENQYLFNVFLHFFILGRVFIGWLLLNALEKKYPAIHRSRMDDTQILRYELVILLFIETILFFVLYRQNSGLTTIFLSWTYATLFYKAISAVFKHLYNSMTIYNHD